MFIGLLFSDPGCSSCVLQYDESCEPERAAMKAREQTEANARARALTRQEWERLQQVRPHSPFDTQRGPQGNVTQEGR